jgi:hypothetical protein
MDTNWHQKEPSRVLKLQKDAEIWNWARNEKWYKNDIKSSEGQNFDIISQLYHPLKNDIKISLSSKKWYNDIIVYQWSTIFQCLIMGGESSNQAVISYKSKQQSLGIWTSHHLLMASKHHHLKAYMGVGQLLGGGGDPKFQGGSGKNRQHRFWCTIFFQKKK